MMAGTLACVPLVVLEMQSIAGGPAEGSMPKTTSPQ